MMGQDKAILLCFFVFLLFEFSTCFVVRTTPHNTKHNQVVAPLNSQQESLTNTAATTSTKDDWWKDFEFQYQHDVAERIRHEFPILNSTTDQGKPIVYLDSAATSHKPNSVVKRLVQYYQEENSNVHRGAHALSRQATAAYEQARDVIAEIIGANSRDEVIFTSGATEAINLVAQTYGRASLKEGDEIVTTVMEHHSNFVPWQMLANEKNLKIKYIPVNTETGELDLEEMENVLNEKTKLVAFQHVSNVMGCIHPIDKMVSLVKNNSPNAKILLDACQSIPHFQVSVKDLGVDWVVASGHKACGPTGSGFLWGNLELLNDNTKMPPFMGGGEMIDTVSTEGVSFAKSPAKFEAGTPPIAQAIGMAAGFQYLADIGWDKIEAYEHEMANYLYKRLSDIPEVEILGPSKNRAALCSIVSDKIHASDLSSFLDMEGIAIRAGHHCCQPLHQHLGHSHSARASLYIYNTKEDIDRFIEELEKTLEFFDNLGSESQDGAGGDDDFVPFI